MSAALAITSLLATLGCVVAFVVTLISAGLIDASEVSVWVADVYTPSGYRWPDARAGWSTKSCESTRPFLASVCHIAGFLAGPGLPFLPWSSRETGEE
ncbi:hypothetical protein ANO14919_047890 [Xylariales sp. No.14919]|nr:hypothetical protein ANO14919_047890 [Xylariales sp. No.14919]